MSSLSTEPCAAVHIGEAPVALLFGPKIGQRLVRIAGVAETIGLAETSQGEYPWTEALASQVWKIVKPFVIIFFTRKPTPFVAKKLHIDPSIATPFQPSVP